MRPLIGAQVSGEISQGRESLRGRFSGERDSPGREGLRGERLSDER